MTRLENAVKNSENYAFEMKYKPDFPIEFLCGENPFSDKHTMLLGEIIHPDDYRPFCEIIGEIISGHSDKIRAHARLIAGGTYRWYYISAAPEKRADGSVCKISGMMFDMTQYFGCDGEDPVMRKFKKRISAAVKSVENPPRLADILGTDYLEHIQESFLHIKGLCSAIFGNDGKLIANAYGQSESINLNKLNYQRKKDIRIKHQNVASWVIASDSLDDVNEAATLLDIMVQTVSNMANSYLVISEEMENSQNANKLLGQNFEDQILINNIYSLILQSRNTETSFGCIIPLIKEYFGLDDILYCSDSTEPVKVYRWDESGSIMPVITSSPGNPNVDKELENNSVVCVSEDTLRGMKSTNRSCALSRIYENGSSRGVIVLIASETGREWTNRDRKVIRNITQIINTVIYRSFMENELAVSQENLMRLAYYNTATGIPNRSAFERDFRQAVSEGGRGAVVSIEIANLKHLSEVNTTQYADNIVRSIAEYITAIPTESEKKVYRFSNDILFVLLDKASRGEAMSLAQAILIKFRSPWFLNDSENRLDIYAGIGLFPDNADDIADCVRVATRTLRLAKDRKLHDAVSYSEGLEEKLDDNQRVKKLITDAVENKFEGFYFLYTPIVDVHTGELVACDAHLYWSNNDIIVSRERFQPIVERMGMEISLFRFVAERVCNFCATVREAGLPQFHIEFSYPEYVMNSDESVIILRKALLDCSLPPEAVCILASESDGTIGISNKSLKQMNSFGMKIVADDRGGNFFTAALLDNPFISTIKMRSRRLSDDPITAAFVKSLIERAHKQGINVIVKGVDNSKALEKAQEFGVDNVQGIINGRPLHTSEFLNKMVINHPAAK